MVNGGIIEAAIGLIKEKEKQGDKAMDRLHDGMNKQMELRANEGSWTGEHKPAQPSTVTTKEKVVEKEPEESEPTETSSKDEDDKGKSLFKIASM